MFNAISWSEYGLAVLLLLLVYYAYVLAVYYRPEIGALCKARGGGVAPPPAAPDQRPLAGTSSLLGASSLIAASMVAPPALPRVEEREHPEATEAALPTLANSPAEVGVEGEEPVLVAQAEEVALVAEAGTSPVPELVDTSSLLLVAELSEFLATVEAGRFTPADAPEAPAGLENTVLLQDIFTAGLARRRASLAVLETL